MSNAFTPLVTCFPDAAAIFKRTFKSVAEIKGDCLVALDTNVLLAPYSLSKEPLTQIEQTYEMLVKHERLVVPGQVAREFARNRSTKLGELLKSLQDQKSKITAPIEKRYEFLKSIPAYSEALKLAEEIGAKQKELTKKIGDVADQLRTWDLSDPVWLIYRRLFAGSVRELSQDALRDLGTELKHRSTHSIPPGYKDAGKPDEGAGDLIIWKTLLELGAEKKRDLVLVTLDQKTDWWSQSGGAPLFPRFELVEEYAAASDGATLHLLLFSEFLSVFGAGGAVVEEVQLVELAANTAVQVAAATGSAAGRSEAAAVAFQDRAMLLRRRLARVNARISADRRLVRDLLANAREDGAQKLQLRRQLADLEMEIEELLRVRSSIFEELEHIRERAQPEAEEEEEDEDGTP
ncbi:MAG: PIN-like domain-containing protein [Beijerinckiaceae bacterium]